jgi:uncharacterized membrane protein YphA (DoxX/SURF4 family)
MNWISDPAFGYKDPFCNQLFRQRSIEQREVLSMAEKSRLKVAWWTLRVGLGAGPFLAGLDKFFNRLTSWDMYLNPAIPAMLHVSVPTFMHLVGVVEMAAGVLVFTRFTRQAAYIVMAWLLAISASLVAQGLFLDIAVRDVELALGAFVLAKLTEIRESAEDESRAGPASDQPEGFEHLA